jgi:hypothetical protein
MTQMENSDTEGLGLVIGLIYSHILSNTSVLSAVDTGFALIAALIPQAVCFNDQLYEATRVASAGKSAGKGPS